MGNGVIIVGSSPSLPETASLIPHQGLAVCAISTSVRGLPISDQWAPEYWVNVDRLNKNHGPDMAKLAVDARILKIFPEHRRQQGHVDKSTQPVAYYARLKIDPGHGGVQPRQWFDGKLPLMRSFNRSMIFGLQVMAYLGHNPLIFTGVTLKMYRHDSKPMNRNHCWPDNIPLKRSQKMQNKHNREINVLKRATLDAAKRGITFLSWNRDSVLNEFMESYEPVQADLSPPEDAA